MSVVLIFLSAPFYPIGRYCIFRI